MSITTAYKNSIVLQIDEEKRIITNGGKSTPIILGVKGDDCAERVYFESPRVLSPEIDLLQTKDEEGNKVEVHVYVNYKSATTDVYIQECKNLTQSATSDVATFSWLVTNNATEAKGDVKFNICIKKNVYNPETKNMELVNEWHTTPFIGKVLDSIDVSRKTPEIITHDSVTMEALTVQVNEYKVATSNYADRLAELNATLENTEVFLESQVNAKLAPAVTAEVDSKMGEYALAEDVEVLSNNLGMINLGIKSDALTDTTNIVEPGVYTFTTKPLESSIHWVMVVDKTPLGTITQSIYGNFNSTGQFYYYRYTENNGTTWTDPVQKAYAYEDDIGMKNLGLKSDALTDTTNVVTPGVYTFYTNNLDSKIQYIMVVNKTPLGTTTQSIYGNFDSEGQFYYLRSTKDNGSTWSSPVQKAYAYEDDILLLEDDIHTELDDIYTELNDNYMHLDGSLMRSNIEFETGHGIECEVYDEHVDSEYVSRLYFDEYGLLKYYTPRDGGVVIFPIDPGTLALTSDIKPTKYLIFDGENDLMQTIPGVGELRTATRNFEPETNVIPKAGDRIKVYIMEGRENPECNSGVIEFELYSPASNYVVGRGCYIDTLGYQSKIISVEFIYTQSNNNVQLHFSLYGLTDIGELQDEIAIDRIELFRYKQW